MSAIRNTGLESLITNIRAKKEGYIFEVSDANKTAFENLLNSNNFLSGSFYKAHSDDVGCKGKPPSQCRDFRSKKNTYGINGSIQIVYNETRQLGYIDVDRINPYQGIRGFGGHTLEVINPVGSSYRPSIISRVDEINRGYRR